MHTEYLRLKQVKEISKGHIAPKWHNQHLNLGVFFLSSLSYQPETGKNEGHCPGPSEAWPVSSSASGEAGEEWRAQARQAMAVGISCKEAKGHSRYRLSP